jgi:3-deoxy-manno-octulosonate cytidylyltransferase (CMP-KDO synthetase)
MKTAIIIPARYSSTRFPGKPLVKLLGKPMILWVCELSSRAVGKDNVYVATESTKIRDVVESSGFRCVLTSDNCLTGTDRVAEAARSIKADNIINVQGDEPLLDPEDILKVIRHQSDYPRDVINAYCYMSESEDPSNVNIPKVVTTEENKLLYMSRAAIPRSKSSTKTDIAYKKQVCIYSFSKEQLDMYSKLERKSYLEEIEDIEILRFHELGVNVRLVETSPGTHAVDVPEDVDKVEKELRKLWNL